MDKKVEENIILENQAEESKDTKESPKLKASPNNKKGNKNNKGKKRWMMWKEERIFEESMVIASL